jgi:hypothetical protein
LQEFRDRIARASITTWCGRIWTTWKKRRIRRDGEARAQSGAGSGTGGPNDPLIKALIQKLPTEGSWPTDDRINWLKMLVMGFQVAYGADAEIEIKKKEAAK